MDHFLVKRITPDDLEAHYHQLQQTSSRGRALSLTLVLEDEPRPASAPAGPPRDVASDAIVEEEEPSRKRPRTYSSTDLNETEKNLVLEKLLDKSPSGSFSCSCPEVLDFFSYNFKSIGKKLTLRTLQRWREEATKEAVTSVSVKQGRPYILPLPHRLAMGNLLKTMGAAGSPMNTKIARPILIGYLQSVGLAHLYEKKAQPGKISFSSSWIRDLFVENQLADRKGTTAAQHLPEVSHSLSSFSHRRRTGNNACSSNIFASHIKLPSIAFLQNWYSTWISSASRCCRSPTELASQSARSPSP